MNKNINDLLLLFHEILKKYLQLKCTRTDSVNEKRKRKNKSSILRNEQYWLKCRITQLVQNV
jgi:hypothetical protein